jgi:hypothetical protein
MSDTRPLCTATRKDGSPCKGRALPGHTECFSHVRKGEAASEHGRKAQAAQVRSRRARKLNSNALRREVTETRALDVAARCLSGVPLDQPDSVRNYLGQRNLTPEGVYIGLLILLVLTGAHTSPSAARAALEETVPSSLRPSFVPPVEDIYRAGRAAWRKAAMLYSEAAGLFVSDYPPNLIAAWEDPVEVTKREPLPTFEGWQVEPLGDSPTHVLARSSEGDEVIVRRWSETPAGSDLAYALG